MWWLIRFGFMTTGLPLSVGARSVASTCPSSFVLSFRISNRQFGSEDDGGLPGCRSVI